MSSFNDLIPCAGATTSTLGALVTCDTPAKSRSVSNGSFEYSPGVAACETELKNNV